MTVRFNSLEHNALRDLAEARKLVVEDEEILSGTPIIRGTRIPVHDVAAVLRSGVSREGILRMYPSLNERQISLAEVYAEAAPLRGRPRKLSPPQGARVQTLKRQP